MPEALRVAVFWEAMALVAVHLGLALAAAGIPAFTALVGPRAVKRLKIFTDKFGQQAATFALLGGFWALLVLSGGFLTALFLAPAVSVVLAGTVLPGSALGASLVCGVVVFLAYRGLWHRLKSRKSLHVALGLLATLFFWLALYAGLAVLRPLAVPVAATGWTSLLVPPGPALFWRLLVEGLLLSLYLAGTFTGAWLVWRRGRDDFGRDYYNFTMRLTARLGLWAGVASLGGMVWVAWGLLPAVGEVSARMTLALALYGLGMLVAVCSCGFLAAQENALRHKFLLLLAFAGSVAAVTGLLAGLANVFWPGV